MGKAVMLNPNMPIVRGYRKTIVQNLIQEKYYVFENNSFDRIRASIDASNTNPELPKGVLVNLKEKGIILEVEDVLQEYFVEPPMNFIRPFKLISIVIDYLDELSYSVFFDILPPSYVHLIIKLGNEVKVKELIESNRKHQFIVTFKYHESWSRINLEKFSLLNCLEVHCFGGKESRISQDEKTNTIFHYHPIILKNLSRFSISENSFFCNIPLYYESLNYNAFHNGKIHITVNGEIKDSAFSNVVFAYLKDVNTPIEFATIVNAIEVNGFWNVKKDLCDVCKHCEYRYMCVEERIPIKRYFNEWYYLEECNYNPYLGKWKGEDGYKTLKETGIVSNNDGFFHI